MRPLFTAACLIALAAPALAQQSLLASYDANGDGVLSFDEFQAAQVDTFVTLDGNGDGGITPAELDARNAKAGRMMQRDSNGDGVLTQSEFLSQSPGFSRADRNNDGVLGAQELVRLEQMLARSRG
ncbi:MAG: hypothetical protein CML66_03380 [Rhodobacteraceae bacterium]|nr:hypothetical protein [Paracoccaceae bacterium]MAY46637.1 hypothetical protein [Paracoccaceae bacterium]